MMGDSLVPLLHSERSYDATPGRNPPGNLEPTNLAAPQGSLRCTSGAKAFQGCLRRHWQSSIHGQTACVFLAAHSAAQSWAHSSGVRKLAESRSIQKSLEQHEP